MAAWRRTAIWVRLLVLHRVIKLSREAEVGASVTSLIDFNGKSGILHKGDRGSIIGPASDVKDGRFQVRFPHYESVILNSRQFSVTSDPLTHEGVGTGPLGAADGVSPMSDVCDTHFDICEGNDTTLFYTLGTDGADEEFGDENDAVFLRRAMIHWRKQGVKSLLHPEHFDKGGARVRGMVLERDVEPQQLLLRVPASELITHENIFASPIGYVFGAGSGGPPPSYWYTDVEAVETLITLYIMWAAENPKAPHHMYGEILRRTDSPLTYLFEPDAKVSAFSDDLRMFRTVILYDVEFAYQEFVTPLRRNHSDLFAGPQYSLHNFTKWYTFYRSRAFVHKNMYLAPLGDFINHGEPNVYHQNDKNGDFLIKAKKHLSAGEEVITFYDSFCQEWMTSFFGFPGIPGNPTCNNTTRRPTHRFGVPLSTAYEKVREAQRTGTKVKYWIH